MPDPVDEDLITGKPRYEKNALDEMAELCSDSHIVGITLMTNYFEGAVQITRHLRSRIQGPIIWGGVHPTLRPVECLEYADFVCVGDGEDAMLDLAVRIRDGGQTHDIPSIWANQEGRIFQNPPRPLVQDLDRFPAPDYSLKDHHTLINGQVMPMTSEMMKEFLMRGTVAWSLNKIGYQTMTGRGCPHKCTYCINDALKSLYKGQKYLRWRSIDHVMAELRDVKARMPFIGFIWISDDAFVGQRLDDIKAFCKAYKENVGLPFSVLASPLTLTEEKMAALIDAGLIYMQMGIQSGSSRIQKLFNRQAMTNQRMMKAIRIINRYKDHMFPPSYDFILDTPYETDVDKISSLRFIADIPKPYHLQPFSLVLYPGTKLHAMSKEDGFLQDEQHQVYGKSYTMRAPSYLNLLMTLAKGGRFPSSLLRLLVSDPAVRLLNNDMMKPFFKNFFIVAKKAYHLLKREKV